MTDEAYVFNETNRERAITKRSAYHKRSGARSKTCKLGVDKMSNAQIQAKHGEVKTWKLKEIYSYEEFKQMPIDIQADYINYLMHTYNVGLATISRELFGLSTKALGVYVQRTGLHSKLKFVKRGCRISAKQRELFKTYISEARGENDVEISEPVEDIFVEQRKETVTDNREPKQIDTISFSTSYISNGFDESIIDLISSMFSNKRIRVTIQIGTVYD